jgi:hypothetical protein
MVLLVMVPTASLSAIYSYFAKDVLDQMDTKYIATLETGITPHELEMHLLIINQKAYQYIISSPDARKAPAADIKTHADLFAENLQEYREMPTNVRQAYIEDEDVDAGTLLRQITSDWEQFQYSVFAILALPNNEDFVPLSRAILADLGPTYDRLLSNIEKIHADDTDVASTMYQEFVRNYRMSFIYGTVAAAASAAVALSIGLLLLTKYSIRLEPREKLTIERSEST